MRRYLPDRIGIRSRMAITLALVFSFGILTIGIMLLLLIRPVFDRIEKEETSTYVARVVNATDQRLTLLENLSRSHAHQPATIEFLSESSTEASGPRLRMDVLDNFELSGVLIQRISDNHTWGVFFDKKPDRVTFSADSVINQIPRDFLKPVMSENEKMVKGIVRMAGQPMQIAVSPVFSPDQPDRKLGYVVVFARIDRALMTSIAENLELIIEPFEDHGGHPMHGFIQSDEDRNWIAETARFSIDLLNDTTDEFLHTGVHLKDFRGEQVYSIEVLLPRTTRMVGYAALWYVFSAIAFVAFVCLIASLFTIEQFVIEPLQAFETRVRDIEEDKVGGPMVNLERQDELGDLARAFDKLLTTLEVQSEELKREKLRAEEANLAKSQFLTNMSHEIRTPLHAIIGFAEVISKGLSNGLAEDDQKQYTDLIFSSGHHLLEIINTILDLSRIEAGRFAINEADTDIKMQVDQVMSVMSIQAQDKSVTLTTEDLDEMPLIYVDTKCLRQILLNLISNAIKFTDAGGKITVRGRVCDESVWLEVADTGVGISDDHLELILEPFEQVEDVLTRSQDGTGLGLAIVKNMVDMHQAELKIISKLGEGSRFSVGFPRWRADMLVGKTTS